MGFSVCFLGFRKACSTNSQPLSEAFRSYSTF
jgi:hypothetical protein